MCRLWEGLRKLASVIYDHIVKRYTADVTVVKDFDVEIEDREFMVLVGPSGCGKSTVLRMLAGLETITEGRILVGDRVVNNVAAKDRDLAMVFQSYALYPHMSVYDNMAFPLQMQHLKKPEIDRRVRNASRILGLEAFLSRKPRALSGGQRQRVALGRAIVRNPKVFLLDEPLSNLDAKLRVQMRVELKKLHLRLGTTAVYVTHDQVEAMTLGDRVVVMKDGLVQQVGEPLELYNRPANRFVAGFLGSPAMNFASVKVTQADSGLWAVNDGMRIQLPPEMSARLKPYVGEDIGLGIRPEDLHLARNGAEQTFEVLVEVVEKLGSEILLDVKAGSTPMVAAVEPNVSTKPRDRLRLALDPARLHFFDARSGAAI